MRRSLPIVRGLVSFLLCLVCALTLASPSGAQERLAIAVRRPVDPHRPWVFVNLTSSLGIPRGGGHVFSVIRELSGNPNGVVLHFSEVTLDQLTELNPAFIVLSPQGTPWCRYTGERGIALQNFLWTLRFLAEELNVPMLGICGGHQALALAFGGKVGPIRGGENDCMPYTRERQTGVVPLTLEAPDPIFSGISGKLLMLESHYDEVKLLPKSFVRLATERLSPIQIMRHATKPVYGIQGHPEHFSGNRPDGGLLIRNFLKIVTRHNKTFRNPVPAGPSPRMLSQRNAAKLVGRN